MKYGTQTKSVKEVQGMKMLHPAGITTSDDILTADMSFDYQLKEGEPVINWTPSEMQEAVLAFIDKEAVFTADDVRGKLLSVDEKKYRMEGKLLDNKVILATCKKALIFGLASFSAQENKKGHVTFKFIKSIPAELPFFVTFRSPEEAEKARLAALDKRVTKAMSDKKEQDIVVAAIAKVQPAKEAEIPANVEAVA